MLCLSRKSGEAIFIGDHVQVRILEVRGQNVKIGITAPRAVAIMREELLDGWEDRESQLTEGRRETPKSI